MDPRSAPTHPRFDAWRAEVSQTLAVRDWQPPPPELPFKHLAEAPPSHTWDQAMLGELKTATEALGMVDGAPFVLGTLSHAMLEGRRYDADESRRELILRHGEDAAHKLLDDAQDAGRHLPPKFRNQLRASGMATHPGLISALATAWRLRKSAR